MRDLMPGGPYQHRHSAVLTSATFEYGVCGGWALPGRSATGAVATTLASGAAPA